MIDLLRNRRSIRKYTHQSVEPEKVKILEEAVLRSPSSKNLNPWNFIFVDDTPTIRAMEQCKPHGTSPLKTAPLAVIIIADGTKSDVWIEDCSIASILLQLTAQSLGLGSCWIQIRERMKDESVSSEFYLKKLLAIPEKYHVLSVIAIGYPDQPRTGKPYNELQFEKLHRNKF